MKGPLEGFEFLDLTHVLHAGIPSWTGSCGFNLEIKRDYDQVFRVQQIKMHGSAGTHMDSPAHRFEKGRSIAEIPLEELISPACVIDVSKKAHADYEISVEDVQLFEERYGPIAAGSFVIGFTGWSRFWNKPEMYRNVDARGQRHFPAFSAASAEMLLERNVVGIGIDTLSPDCLDQSYPVHRILLGAGKYIVENIANVEAMRPSGGYVIVLPIRTEGGAEAPVRIIGLVQK